MKAILKSVVVRKMGELCYGWQNKKPEWPPTGTMPEKKMGSGKRGQMLDYKQRTKEVFLVIVTLVNIYGPSQICIILEMGWPICQINVW